MFMLKNNDVPFLIPENFKNLDLKIPKIIFLEWRDTKVIIFELLKTKATRRLNPKQNPTKFMVMTSKNISSLEEPVKKFITLKNPPCIDFGRFSKRYLEKKNISKNDFTEQRAQTSHHFSLHKIGIP